MLFGIFFLGERFDGDVTFASDSGLDFDLGDTMRPESFMVVAVTFAVVVVLFSNDCSEISSVSSIFSHILSKLSRSNIQRYYFLPAFSTNPNPTNTFAMS